MILLPVGNLYRLLHNLDNQVANEAEMRLHREAIPCFVGAVVDLDCFSETEKEHTRPE